MDDMKLLSTEAEGVNEAIPEEHRCCSPLTSLILYHLDQEIERQTQKSATCIECKAKEALLDTSIIMIDRAASNLAIDVGCCYTQESAGECGWKGGCVAGLAESPLQQRGSHRRRRR